MARVSGIVVDEESPLLKREGSIQSNIRSLQPLNGMQIRCHCIHSDGTLHESSPDQCFKHQKSSNKDNSKCYWIDIDAGVDQKKLKTWLSQLNLPNFVVDVLASPPESVSGPLHKYAN